MEGVDCVAAVAVVARTPRIPRRSDMAAGGGAKLDGRLDLTHKLLQNSTNNDQQRNGKLS
eukprot:951142-Pyramimonas_sp.AAC.2